MLDSLDEQSLVEELLRRVRAGMPNGPAPTKGREAMLALAGARNARVLRQKSAEWCLTQSPRVVGMGRIPRTNSESFEREEHPISISDEDAVTRIVAMALEHEKSRH